MTLWPKPLAERSSSASGQWTCHLDAESSKAQDHSLHWRQDPSQSSQRCGGKPLQRDSPNNPRQAINFQVISRYAEVKSSSLTPRLPPYHVAALPAPGVHSQARDSAELPFVFAKLALAPEFTGKQPLGSFLAEFFFWIQKIRHDTGWSGPPQWPKITSEDSHHQLTGGVLGWSQFGSPCHWGHDRRREIPGAWSRRCWPDPVDLIISEEIPEFQRYWISVFEYFWCHELSCREALMKNMLPVPSMTTCDADRRYLSVFYFERNVGSLPAHPNQTETYVQINALSNLSRSVS